MARSLGILILIMALTSCTASSSYQYSGAKLDNTIDNQQSVEENFEVVWDRLIKNLSSEFFVINNVEKASRIINVSFSTNKPSEIIDCGQTRRSYTDGRGNSETYDYPTADSIRYRVASDDGLFAYEFDVSKSVEGRANIYVAPIDGGTEIAVNIRYIWDVKIEAYEINRLNSSYVAGPEYQTYTYSFETGRPLDEFIDGERLSCRSKGVLEQRIIDAARPS